MRVARPSPKLRSLAEVLGRVDNTLKRELTADVLNDDKYPNNETRESFGHYVEVAPIALPNPRLTIFSPAMAKCLGLDPTECSTEPFARFFSGDRVAGLPDVPRAWSTPYAVSVFGQPILSPDPFGRGNAYGDGRAVSLGEVLNEQGDRWELQLKGSGTTPFSRGGDGRAVLRSSIREFMASEAMEALGVPTTRALSLVVSGSQRVRRAWYKENDRGRQHPPDTLVTEPCAITCRAAPSFIRVGHIELHARRATRQQQQQERGEARPPAEADSTAQLRVLLEHAIRREFSREVDTSAPLQAQLEQLLRAFAGRQAALAAHWLRVGYVQGNMNSDNCLLSGRTMDYGPFGFVEEYQPMWSPFTSDAERKFGFERQPLAAQVNLMTLARSLLPLFDRTDERGVEALQTIVQDEYASLMEREIGSMRRAKMGLAEWDEAASATLWPQLQSLMSRASVDYTLLWRQLAYATPSEVAAAAAGTASPLLQRLRPAFYSQELLDESRAEWCEWLSAYGARLERDARDADERAREMRATSPKYVPREWMLAQAYEAADRGDLSVLRELYALLTSPYDEHPELEEKYYRRTPDAYRQKAGITYFS